MFQVRRVIYSEGLAPTALHQNSRHLQRAFCCPLQSERTAERADEKVVISRQLIGWLVGSFSKTKNGVCKADRHKSIAMKVVRWVGQVLPLS